MSNVAGKQRWVCPGCERSYSIPAGKKAPELCPDCRQKDAPSPFEFVPAAAAPPAAAPAKEPPPVVEAPAEPAAEKKYVPLAVVLPQIELDDNLIRMNERRFYAELAWRIVAFWVHVTFIPGVIALCFVDPVAGMFGFLFWMGLWMYLTIPVSVGDRIPLEEKLKNRNYW